MIYGTKPARAPSSFAEYRRSRTVAIPQEDRTALPILNKPEMEAKLVKHIMDRVDISDPARNRRADRAQSIDVQLSGFIKLSKDDQKRAADNSSGKAPKPTDHNLPLTEAQIDECMTYLMSVYAPEMDFFEAVAPADKQAMAQAMVAELNKQSQKAQYYRHMAKGLLNMLKYNIGGWPILWEQRKGVVFKGSPGGAAKKENGIVWQGNVITSFDIYNTFFDESVHPVDLPEQGEYFAWVERKTPFRVQKMRQDGQLYGIERYIHEVIGDTLGNSSDGKSLYKTPPSVRDEKSIRENGTINWSATLRGTSVQESTPGLELLHFIGWLKPGELGLDNPTNKNLELWRVTLGNSKCVTAAFKLEDSHGMLPLAVGCPLEDDLRNEQRTYAEKLLPLQHFSSFLLNSHQAATRKAIYGFTVFVQSLFPGLDLEREDLIGAMIPMRSSAGDIDIDKAIRHYNDAPQTDRNVDMLAQIDGVMQKILPTDRVRNVADLERATMYQAAATVQASDQRQLKVARIISDQALNPMKFQMIYNCYANLESISYVDEGGTRQTKSMGDIVEANIEYEIGTGLKGLDKLMQLQILRDILQFVIQSQQALQEIDIVAFLDYYMTLAGDRTDFRQFRRKTPAIDPTTGQPLPIPQPSQANVPGIPATGGDQG